MQIEISLVHNKYSINAQLCFSFSVNARTIVITNLLYTHHPQDYDRHVKCPLYMGCINGSLMDR